MKKLYPKEILNYQKKEHLSFILVLAMFYITVFNTSCSANLDETKSSIIENFTLDSESEDTVLSYIKTISSIKYKLTYIDSIVNEKKISKDSAYMEYLYFKYSYLIKNFYNNEKYDTIDLSLYFTKYEYSETPYTKTDYGEVMVNGSYVNFANECIRMIQGNVVSCPPYVNGDQCRRIMMNYAFETIRWLDVSTNLFVEALYRESEHFTQYVSGLYGRPDNGPINARLLKERINLLLQSTSRLHSQFCPNPVPSPGGGSGGSSGSGGNSGEGNENTDLSDNQAKVIGNQAFDKIRTDLNNNKVHLNHVSINNEGQALLNGVSAGPNTIGIITSCLNFMDEANVGPLATNFGRGISGLGLVIGGAQTYIAFTDENISLSDRLGAISTALNAAGFICAFVPGGLVVSGVLGVTSCIIGLVATVVPNKTALLVEVTLEDNIKVYVYIPAMA